MHGIIWLVITFLLMSEWPKGGRLGNSGWKRFWDAWKGLSIGLLTFLLSGLLGFILLYRSPIPSGASFQNIMPAFVGLFAIPWCLLNLVSKQPIPKQQEIGFLKLRPRHLLHGMLSGGLGGGFAAFFPVITGGIGGLLAGHATAQRDERIFMIAQGASKTIYYTGGLLLFFIPGLHLTRGGGAWILRGLVPSPEGHASYLMALGCIAISGGLAFLLLAPLARLLLRIMQHIPVRIFSAITLLLVGVMIYFVTGWSGIFIMLIASGIGFLPLLYGARRINALGLLLLPMACNMSGFGNTLAHFLGLL
jgi:putative membrane protein